MPDMLVKLYELPSPGPALARAAAEGVTIRRAAAYEKVAVVDWVQQVFSANWAAECDVAFSNRPASCFIATADGVILGFACYESTCRNFFGPTGVDTAHRGRGIGTALLLISLQALAELGYAYAIIGGVGPADFYRRAAGAIMIEGSSPGIYRDSLKT